MSSPAASRTAFTADDPRSEGSEKWVDHGVIKQMITNMFKVDPIAHAAASVTGAMNRYQMGRTTHPTTPIPTEPNLSDTNAQNPGTAGVRTARREVVSPFTARVHGNQSRVSPHCYDRTSSGRCKDG